MFNLIFCAFDYYFDCVSRQYVKIMVSRSRNFLHWLMEEPYGACLIIIFARIFIVRVLWRCYMYSFPSFLILYIYRSISLPLFELFGHRTLKRQVVKNQLCQLLIIQMRCTILYFHRN